MSDSGLAGALAEYYTHLEVERGNSPRTVASYTSDLQQFSQFLATQNITELKRLTLRVVRQFMIARQRAGDGPTTMNRKLTSIRSFIHYLYRHGKISNDFSDLLQGVKKPKVLPRHLSEDETGQLLADPQILRENSDPMEQWRQARDHMMSRLLYATGVRASELVGLTLDKVSLAGRMIKVFGKGRKERLIPLPDTILPELRHYLDEVRPRLIYGHPDSQALFPGPSGQPLTTKTLRRRLALLAQNNGLLKRITPHMLRHSYATHLLAHHADLRSIQLLLGHTGLGATQRYTALALQQLQETYLKAHPHGKK